MTILVTGGAGYIGSHCCVTLLEAGYDVVVLDNFSNSNAESLSRVEEIAGKPLLLEQADVRDQAAIEAVLARHQCSAVIHFAGLKAVGESVKQPLSYYENNVIGTHRLLSAMSKAGVHDLIFSSSATVYGEPQQLPLTEDHPLAPTNPYGRTKLIVEDMLRDLSVSDPRWRIGILRYFNPVGAHGSGMIGEDPLGVPNNLLPVIAQVASGRLEKLNVFGDDYETRDGTGVRDFIHVVDLARGHLNAYEALRELDDSRNSFTVNLGTGNGFSVLEMVKEFERASNRQIPFTVASRRPGDIAECYADTNLASELLSWRASKDLKDMCADTWNWVVKNPQGYQK